MIKGLREKIMYSLTRVAVNGVYIEKVNKEFVLHETDQILLLIRKELKKETKEIGKVGAIKDTKHQIVMTKHLDLVTISEVTKMIDKVLG